MIYIQVYYDGGNAIGKYYPSLNNSDDTPLTDEEIIINFFSLRFVKLDDGYIIPISKVCKIYLWL